MPNELQPDGPRIPTALMFLVRSATEQLAVKLCGASGVLQTIGTEKLARSFGQGVTSLDLVSTAPEAGI